VHSCVYLVIILGFVSLIVENEMNLGIHAFRCLLFIILGFVFLIVENEMNLGIRAFKCLFYEYKKA
jgi:hypothetical protein